MITLSAKLYGVISLGTLHIKLGIDLPVEHWQGKLGFVSVDITTGPRTVAAPAHSVQAVKVEPQAVAHTAPDPAVTNWN
jgi:hypothetical protein